MKKLFVISLVIFLRFSLVYALDELHLWNGESITTETLLFENGKVIIDSDKTLDSDSISYILFDADKNAGASEEFESVITVDEMRERAEYLERKYSDASLLILHDHGIQKLRKDKSHYSKSTMVMKIMNESQLDRAVISYYFAKGSYETRITAARSIDAEGNEYHLSDDDYVYTKPRQGMSFFSGRRDGVIVRATIPGVTVGSIVEYTMETVKYDPEDHNQFYPQWYFNTIHPVYHSSVVFEVPLDQRLFFDIKNNNFSIKRRFKFKDGMRHYYFESEKLKPFESEPKSPPDGELLMSVKGSTFRNQDYLAKWYSELLQERMVINEDIVDACDSYLEEKRLSGVSVESEREKVSVLYRFMQEKIRYLSIKTSLSSGQAGHPAIETFNNQYGDCIDKSILFAAILRHYGIDGYPVVLMTNDNAKVHYGKKIGLLSGNHAINEVHFSDGSVVLLDSTAVTAKFPYFGSSNHGVYVWNPLLNAVRFSGYYDPREVYQTFDIGIQLKKDGTAFITEKRIYKGDSETGIRRYFKESEEQDIFALLYSMVNNRYPGSRLVDLDFSDVDDYSSDFSFTIKYEAVGVAEVIDDLMITRMPESFDFSFLYLDDRKHPVEFKTTSGHHLNVEIVLPDGVKIESLPDDISFDNKFFSFDSNFAFEKNVFRYKSSYYRDNCFIKPREYDIYKELMLDLSYSNKNPVVFKLE